MRLLIQLFLFVTACTLSPSCKHLGEQNQPTESQIKNLQKLGPKYFHQTIAIKKGWEPMQARHPFQKVTSVKLFE